MSTSLAVVTFALGMILITAAAVLARHPSLLVRRVAVKPTTGRSWHLWCPEHGSHRGPILWGKGTAPVVPCPRCGSETPNTFTKEYR